MLPVGLTASVLRTSFLYVVLQVLTAWVGLRMSEFLGEDCFEAEWVSLGLQVPSEKVFRVGI